MTPQEKLAHLNGALSLQLKKIRESSAVTVQQLSQALGYGTTTIRNKESNQSTITTLDLVNYATYFNLFPSDIVSMAEQELVRLEKEK